MRILIVCDDPSTAEKGSVIAVDSIIGALKDKGHEVAAVCRGEGDDAREKEGFIRISAGGIMTAGRSVGNDEAIKRTVERSLELLVWDSDIVHITRFTPLGRAALSYALKHNIPVTAGFRAGITESPSRKLAGNVWLANRSLYRMMYNSFYRYADAVLYPTQTCRRLLESSARRTTNGFVLTEQTAPDSPVKGVFGGAENADIIEDMLYSVR